MAREMFDQCFKNLDGRGDANSSTRLSIKSGLSRTLSIKSRSTTMMMMRRGTQNTTKSKGGEAMQRVAVTLRQKQEYSRAEALLSKAI